MSCIDPERCWQDRDNYNWVRDAAKNQLVVGSQARILYSDAEGRVRIALAFNEMVRRGKIGPIIIGRDHHDVSGTDSPYRETSNIHDGSNVMADMAFHCWAGNAARGMTLVVASNGGGVGIGRAINTGFGLVLDGSERVDAHHPFGGGVGRDGRRGAARVGAQRSRRWRRRRPGTPRRLPARSPATRSPAAISPCPIWSKTGWWRASSLRARDGPATGRLSPAGHDGGCPG